MATVSGLNTGELVYTGELFSTITPFSLHAVRVAELIAMPLWLRGLGLAMQALALGLVLLSGR